MKKILFLIGKIDIGGTEKQLYYLVKGLLHKKIYNISIFVSSPKVYNFLDRKFSDLNINIQYSKSNNKFYKLYTLSKVILLFKPDIIHSCNIYLNPIAYFSGIFSNSLKISSIRFQAEDNIINQFKLGFLLKYVVKWPDLYIFNNKYSMNIKSIITSDQSGVKLLLVNNGIANIQSYQEPEFDENHFTIGYIGRLDKYKNVEYLVKTYLKLIPKYKYLHLKIVGDGSQKIKIEKLLKDNIHLSSQVQLLEFSDNIKDHLNSFDIFCLPSLREGMPNAIIEAMSMSCPVISSNAGGCIDLNQNMENSFMFDLNIQDDLLDKILYVLKNKSELIPKTKKAYEYIKKEYSMLGMIQSHSKIYEKYT